jgi:hypothetical protein
MCILAIVRVKNNKIKIKDELRTNIKSALFSLKFSAKSKWVLTILRVKNIRINLKILAY